MNLVGAMNLLVDSQRFLLPVARLGHCSGLGQVPQHHALQHHQALRLASKPFAMVLLSFIQLLHPLWTFSPAPDPLLSLSGVVSLSASDSASL